MDNPYYDVHETSLSKLSEHDWNVLSSRWRRGIDWNVAKLGKRHWYILGEQFKAWRLFKTKTAAYEAHNVIMLAEARSRAAKRYELAK